MKKVYFLCILWLWPVLAAAQNTYMSAGSDSVKKQALIFEISGLNLHALEGGIGYKSWISERSVSKYMIKIAFSQENKEKNESLKGQQTNTLTLGCLYGFERHLKKQSGFSPYFGAQLGIIYESIENKVIPNTTEYYERYSYGYKNEFKRKELSFPLYFVTGVEYFFLKHFSFSGQYLIGGYYCKGEETTNSNIVNSTQKISKFYLGISSSSLILSIYF